MWIAVGCFVVTLLLYPKQATQKQATPS